ncbi:type II toxin-antitoxin system HicA family toxin [Mycobacteroides abscessus]|uniref:type II toxin-antitoxin system HicA family toxin n=1 Tax=Mycobacteroides abscessus TaxID=36809 RepID=UPI0009A7A360|nr:type II toxin-antitoxin system HicA family toxin [Mycobacteroides abscessus]SLH42620.1 YcfA-like protein [Mycobacteroides abscessus subsp. abscessus]
MVSEEPTRKTVNRLKDAGFVKDRTDGSHSTWVHPSGARITIADGHRTTSPGVVRKVNQAIKESEEG